MSLDSEPTAAREFLWHVSDVHRTPDPSERDLEELLSASDEPGRDGAQPVLPPLWYRIVTGQSFAWRIRRDVARTRRGLARRVLRWLQLHPELRHAAHSGDSLRLVADGLRARRRQARVTHHPYRPRVRLPNRVVAMPPTIALVGDVDLDGSSGPVVSVAASADGALVEVVGSDGRTTPVLGSVDLRRSNPSSFQQRPSGRPIGISDVFDEVTSPRARIARAQRAWSVRLDNDPDRSATVTAQMVTELAVSGVALVGRLDPSVAELIGAEVVDRIATNDHRAFGDERERELYSLRLRRAALARHSPRGWWQSVGPLVGADVDAVPQVSVLLPSNRPADVVGAARLVEAQVGVRVQLVVGLHGAHMPATLDDDLATAFSGDLLIRRCPDEWTLGHVMNDLTDAATGDLISKWDDDDWYEPQHLADLAWALEYSDSSLVGKAAEFVYLEAIDLTIRRFATGSERRSTTIAGGTLMMTREELVDVGWADVPRQVDRRLIDDLQARGRAIYRTHGFGYILRRRGPEVAQHTWLAGDDYFLRQASDQRTGVALEFAGFGKQT